MNTNFQTLFNAIETKIKADVNEINWLDFDMGQLDFDTPPVSWPCLLVDFANMPLSNAGNGGQIGQPSIQIKVAFKRLERSHFKRDQSIANVAFQQFLVMDKIHTALHSLAGEGFAPLVCTNQLKRTTQRHYEFLYTFTTAIKVTSGVKQYSVVQKPPVVID